MKESQEHELVGVKEIARRANVSIGTVDRVLHNRTGVSIKTKDKVLAIIEELNYQPNILARRLASKKVLTIAVLIPSSSVETGYWSAPLEGIIEAETEVKPYGVIIEKFLFDQNDKQTFLKQSAIILTKNIDGVLMAPMFMEESWAFADQCKKHEIPYVFINSDLPGHKSLSYIGPELHQSGCVGAHLLSYMVAATDEVLIVNISKEIDTLHHLLRKEEGFRTYLNEKGKKNQVVKLDIRDTNYTSVKKELAAVLHNRNITAIFVTNSRVSSVARYLEESGNTHLKLIGYDFLDANIEYLKKGVIEFLISQKPKEQGYKGIITIYNYLMHKVIPGKTNFMPIDIITKENYIYYQN